ncbi:hypothetical protein CK203_043795 [Vitis vinifera]|uniref:Uncharacterized protein n=1 Tax=Vitis vinifera TaxID=29760 RepID=A0A438HWE7_VITVI|nr:hypothetical protein CK203_043795 [Vitis vinifera]
MGRGNMERKVHLVKWEIVCGDKGRGGLGLRKLGLLNKALLGKWIWRFACDRENLWKQVILAKFGQEEYGWRSKKPNGAFGVGLWKEIMKETDWCWDNLEFMVGKGTKIRFWTDVWCAVQRCPKLSRTSLPWLLTGMLLWRRCGIRILIKEVGI